MAFRVVLVESQRQSEPSPDVGIVVSSGHGRLEMAQSLGGPALAEQGLTETRLKLGIVRDELFRCFKGLESAVDVSFQEQ